MIIRFVDVVRFSIVFFLASVGVAHAGAPSSYGSLVFRPDIIADGSARSLDAPTTAVGNTATLTEQTSLVTSVPPGMDVVINSITSDGAAVVDTDCVGAILNNAPGAETCTLTPGFQPQAGGAQSGTISINCDVQAMAGASGITCDGTTRTIYAVSGSGLIAKSVDTLGPAGMTALTLILLLGSALTLRGWA